MESPFSAQANGVFCPDTTTTEKLKQEIPFPVFLTSADALHHRVKTLKEAFEGCDMKLLYAIKANSNPSIAKELKESGLDGIDAVSPLEVALARKLGFDAEDISFTGISMSDADIEEAIQYGCGFTVGSLSELRRVTERIRGGAISLRMNVEAYGGEHKYICTTGAETKFGLRPDELPQAQQICAENDVTLRGLHAHVGSGYYEIEAFESVAKELLSLAEGIDTVESINLGGGFGVRYKPGSTALPLAEFGNALRAALEAFTRTTGRTMQTMLEPGKFLVSESTALLVQVTMKKYNGDRLIIGVNSGFNHLIRPMLYEAYHHIVNLSRPDAPMVKADIVGNICETGDRFAMDRTIPHPEEGDILGILTAGAYCASMSSLYNLRPFAAEALLQPDGGICLTRKPQTDLDALLDDAGFLI